MTLGGPAAVRSLAVARRLLWRVVGSAGCLTCAPPFLRRQSMALPLLDAPGANLRALHRVCRLSECNARFRPGLEYVTLRGRSGGGPMSSRQRRGAGAISTIAVLLIG